MQARAYEASASTRSWSAGNARFSQPGRRNWERGLSSLGSSSSSGRTTPLVTFDSTKGARKGGDGGHAIRPPAASLDGHIVPDTGAAAHVPRLQAQLSPPRFTGGHAPPERAHDASRGAHGVRTRRAAEPRWPRRLDGAAGAAGAAVDALTAKGAEHAQPSSLPATRHQHVPPPSRQSAGSLSAAWLRQAPACPALRPAELLPVAGVSDHWTACPASSAEYRTVSRTSSALAGVAGKQLAVSTSGASDVGSDDGRIKTGSNTSSSSGDTPPRHASGRSKVVSSTWCAAAAFLCRLCAFLPQVPDRGSSAPCAEVWKYSRGRGWGGAHSVDACNVSEKAAARMSRCGGLTFTV